MEARLDRVLKNFVYNSKFTENFVVKTNRFCDASPIHSTTSVFGTVCWHVVVHFAVGQVRQCLWRVVVSRWHRLCSAFLDQNRTKNRIKETWPRPMSRRNVFVKDAKSSMQIHVCEGKFLGVVWSMFKAQVCNQATNFCFAFFWNNK